METIDLLRNNIKTTPKTLFNIGVGPKHFCEYKAFKQLWPVINIIGLEPNMGTFGERIVDYPGKLYPWGLWSVSSIRKFKAVFGSSGKSSLLEPHEQWPGYWSYNVGKTCEETLISCITLDQLDEALGHPQDIFLWMDIEGSELEALRGGCSLLASGRVKWIDLEISIKPRWIGAPDEHSISEYLKTYQFLLKCKYGSSLFFNNALYVKE